MKNKLILTLWCLAMAFACQAQKTSAQSDSVATLTAAKCFVEAPVDILPFASKNARLDMLDYFNAGSDKATANELGGTCRVTSLDDLSISFFGTENISYQLFVLNPGTKNQYIGVIETIPTPIPDSKLTIYDTRWNPQPSKSIDPNLKAWLNAEGKKNPQAVKDALPFIMASFSYDPDTETIIVANHMDQYFSRGEGEKPLSLLNKEISYKWNGKQFRLNK